MKKYYRFLLLGLIMLFWFCLSFISNILGPIIPDIISSYKLDGLSLVGLIPLFFFGSYAIMSVPSGFLLEKWGERSVLIIGFFTPFIGALLFVLAPTYYMLMLSCFIMGLGMAMIQTVLNPLQRIVGGEQNYAFVAEIAQLMFGIASSLSPLVYIYLIDELSNTLPIYEESYFINLLRLVTPVSLPWISLYWIFVCLLGLMTLIVIFVRFPSVESSMGMSDSSTAYHKLFSSRLVWFYFGGVFAYVSTEQSISIFMSTFLERYHNIDPRTVGAETVSHFWLLMTIGCGIGAILLKLVDSRRILVISGICAVICLGIALMGSTILSLYAFPAIGLFSSIMYPIIFSLALNSIESNHGAFAGILCTAICGGAIGPYLISIISDVLSLRFSLMILFISIGYIICIGLWAHPLITNKTYSLQKLIIKWWK